MVGPQTIVAGGEKSKSTIDLNNDPQLIRLRQINQLQAQKSMHINSIMTSYGSKQYLNQSMVSTGVRQQISREMLINEQSNNDLR